MAAGSAAKRARPDALEATVTTVTIPGLGAPDGMFVLGDGTRLFSSGHTILLLTSSDMLATFAGNPLEEVGALKDGQGISARFHFPYGLTVDSRGHGVLNYRKSSSWTRCRGHGVRSWTRCSKLPQKLRRITIN